MKETPILVVIADDHRPTREDIRAALEDDGRFAVVADAPDAFGAIEAAVRERPDLCLLDVAMPGGGVASDTGVASGDGSADRAAGPTPRRGALGRSARSRRA